MSTESLKHEVVKTNIYFFLLILYVQCQGITRCGKFQYESFHCPGENLTQTKALYIYTASKIYYIYTSNILYVSNSGNIKLCIDIFLLQETIYFNKD